MNTQNQYQPIVYQPNYLINAQLGQSFNQMWEWNYMFKQCKEFLENMNSVYRQADLFQRREIISRCQTRELVFFGNKNNNIFSCGPDDFDMVSYYAVNNTCIDAECAKLFMCTYILGAAQGRFTVVNSDHREASVIHALGIANSGQRKSAVNDKLYSPVLDFEEKLKENHDTQSGPFSKQMASYIAKPHINKILAGVDFNKPEELSKAIEEAKYWDSFYNDIQEKIKTPPNINVTEVSPYQLAKIMKENGQAQLMASAEGGGLEKLLFHKDTELALKSYGQEAYTYASAKSQIELRHPALNIAVFCQLSVASKLFGSIQLWNRGTTPRILPYLNLHSHPFSYITLRGDEADIYKGKITKLLQKFYTRDGMAKRFIVGLDDHARDNIHKFRQELDACDHGLGTFQPWMAKLHGQALRAALAIHLWNHPEDPCESLINSEEISFGIEIARNTVNSAFFLHSPYGMAATFDAIKIIQSLQRITGHFEQDDFIRNGTDSRRIQQRTAINRINVNNALQLLSWCGWVAIYDDGSSNFKVLPHNNFFAIKLRVF